MSYGRTQPSAGPVEGAIHGAVVYLGVTIGLLLSSILAQTVGSDSSILISGLGTDNAIFVAAQGGYTQLVWFGPLLAAGLAVYYVASDRGEPAFVAAAVGSAAGTLLSALVLIVLMVVLEPSSVSISIGDELIIAVVISIGAAVTGVVSALGLELA